MKLPRVRLARQSLFFSVYDRDGPRGNLYILVSAFFHPSFVDFCAEFM